MPKGTAKQAIICQELEAKKITLSTNELSSFSIIIISSFSFRFRFSTTTLSCWARLWKLMFSSLHFLASVVVVATLEFLLRHFIKLFLSLFFPPAFNHFLSISQRNFALLLRRIFLWSAGRCVEEDFFAPINWQFDVAMAWLWIDGWKEGEKGHLAIASKTRMYWIEVKQQQWDWFPFLFLARVFLQRVKRVFRFWRQCVSKWMRGGREMIELKV